MIKKEKQKVKQGIRFFLKISFFLLYIYCLPGGFLSASSNHLSQEINGRIQGPNPNWISEGPTKNALSGYYSDFNTIINNPHSSVNRTAVLTVQYIHASKNRHIFISKSGGSIFLYKVGKKIRFSTSKKYRLKFRIIGKFGASIKANYIAHEVVK
jgi:hypothetical protein